MHVFAWILMVDIIEFKLNTIFPSPGMTLLLSFLVFSLWSGLTRLPGSHSFLLLSSHQAFASPLSSDTMFFYWEGLHGISLRILLSARCADQPNQIILLDRMQGQNRFCREKWTHFNLEYSIFNLLLYTLLMFYIGFRLYNSGSKGTILNLEIIDFLFF